MITPVIFLIASLFIILIAAEAFTNGLEFIGKRYSFSQAVVGNILSAVGTALPETILPIVAILFTGGSAAKDIGVGAILGAPFMISTLAFFLVGVTATVCCFKKRRDFKINTEIGSIKRDIIFFIPMYSMAVFAPLLVGRRFAVLEAMILIGGYIFYVTRTVKGESSKVEHLEILHLFKFQKCLGLTSVDTPHTILALFQILASIFVMVAGSRMFVQNLQGISLRFGMDPFLFSLMLAPIATELPEKLNSITWTIKGKDTLALGNLTGAMVFQSTFPVSVGLLFTQWKLTQMALLSAVIAIISAATVLAVLMVKKRIPVFAMLLGGLFYLIYAAALFFNPLHIR